MKSKAKMKDRRSKTNCERVATRNSNTFSLFPPLLHWGKAPRPVCEYVCVWVWVWPPVEGNRRPARFISYYIIGRVMSLIEFLCFGQKIGKRTRCSEYCHPFSLPLYPSASPVPSTAFFAIAWVGCELNEVTFVAAGHLCDTPPAHTPKHTHTQRSSPFSCETLTQLTSLATCVNILSASAGAGPHSTTPPTTHRNWNWSGSGSWNGVCNDVCDLHAMQLLCFKQLKKFHRII